MPGTYAIDSYEIEYSAGTQEFLVGETTFRWRGVIRCRAAGTADALYIAVVPDGEPLPRPLTQTLGASAVGYIWIRTATLGTFVDLLRHEKPLFMRIVPPPLASFNAITTSREPVGEAEAV